MPVLRDTRTGVVVSVDDVTAARLGAAYEPASSRAEDKPSTSRRPAKKSTKK